ncbi:hypothetical protein Vadar_029030 [Vaccinium darrowii]|uniref:Uncharacterized protein n=1 Tax=Vaccinium darrowii TaxID=229202 RepID=A0ACB7X523_9ERIC|nr:hypothetical protein Vadar_029030 [Vaccinium darrowii]
MIFTDDGKYILSSAVAERYVAVWKLDGGKKQSACCVLAMDQPAVCLDSWCVDAGDVDAAGLSVLAISEMGICYFWYGRNIEELRNGKPTKVSLSLDDPFFKSQKGAVHTIFAAKLQGLAKPASGSGHIFLAYGLPIKPSFEKIVVHSGSDIRLNSSSDGLLLPITQSSKSKQGSNKRNEDDFNEVGDTLTVCMEDRLRTLGILDNKDDLTSDILMDSMKLRGINIEATLPQRKMRAVILSMAPSDAYKQLEVLVAMWQSRGIFLSYCHAVPSMFFLGSVAYCSLSLEGHRFILYDSCQVVCNLLQHRLTRLFRMKVRAFYMISRWMKVKMMMLMMFFMGKKMKNPKVVVMTRTRIFSSTRGFICMVFAFPGGFKDRLTWTCLTIIVDVTHSFVSLQWPRPTKTEQNLKLLFELDLSNNRLVGKFPYVVLKQPSLKYLGLRFNEFEGTVPKELFDRPLDAIFINHNHFQFEL